MNNTTVSPFGHFAPKKPAAQRRVTNFLEAFKENSVQRPVSADRGTTSFEEAFRASAGSRAADIIPSSTGELRPEMPLSVSDVVSAEESRKREERARAQERLFAKQREEELEARRRAKQEAVVKEIEQLREAILKIAKSAQDVSREFEKAAFETPVAPGTYHLSFFAKLKSALEMVKRSLDDSASWLHIMNDRNKKIPYFWAQVRKSGTKYMLSSERYMQMSAG